MFAKIRALLARALGRSASKDSASSTAEERADSERDDDVLTEGTRGDDAASESRSLVSRLDASVLWSHGYQTREADSSIDEVAASGEELDAATNDHYPDE